MYLQKLMGPALGFGSNLSIKNAPVLTWFDISVERWHKKVILQVQIKVVQPKRLTVETARVR